MAKQGTLSETTNATITHLLPIPHSDKVTGPKTVTVDTSMLLVHPLKFHLHMAQISIGLRS